MRSTILILLTFIHISSYVFSQDFKGGFMGGITASQIDNDTYGGYNKLGFSAGMFVERDLNDNSAGQFELRYCQKGATESKINYTMRLDYMELGFLYKYSFKSVVFEGGFSPSFLVNVSGEYMDIEDENINFENFDLPMNLGIYYFLGEKFAVNARLSYSAIPVGRYRNNVINFSAFYYIK